MAKAPAKKAKKKVTAKKAANKKVVNKVAKKKVVTKKAVAKKAAAKKVVKKKVAAKKVVAKKVPKKIALKKVVQKTAVKKAPIKTVTKKAVKKVSTKKTSTKPVAKKASKQVIKRPATPDYFKLPFEVHYSEAIPVTQYEFKSDGEVKRFKDVKVVHMEQGRSWGAAFSCSKNNGPELYCCLMNNHDEAEPPWLHFQDEKDIRFNYGSDYAVVIEGDEIKFTGMTEKQQDESSEEFLDVDSMDYCCSFAFMAYELNQSSPDYIILDSDDTRIKIDLEGYELDEEGNRIDARRIINTNELDDEEYEDCATLDFFDVKFEWVKSILETDFKKDKNLKLSFHSE